MTTILTTVALYAALAVAALAAWWVLRAAIDRWIARRFFIDLSDREERS